MAKLICKNCKKVFDDSIGDECPQCHIHAPHIYNFQNSDDFLKNEVPRVMEERKKAGLEGMLGDLECIIINTETDHQQAAVDELLRTTGLDFEIAFDDAHTRTCVLKAPDSADFLIQSRPNSNNPFKFFNVFPKSKHLPNTRLETFVFSVTDIERYMEIQRSQNVVFLTPDIIRTDNYAFIQTLPIKSTGTSIGFIQWTGKRGDYHSQNSESVDWTFTKPRHSWLKNIKELDHTALRVRAEDRDKAIIEFMKLTNYHFDFAIYVTVFNSITNVARLTNGQFAMVFTSGISPYINDSESGPTERFIHNYGTRVHHLAFRTEKIEETYEALKKDGMTFLLKLVGSESEGLKQTFSSQSEQTILVNEYIHRYGDFDGFFTKSNVTLLTGATEKQ
jgi:4-hydroxyphenylpyruvate dioxygenase-like putative hemolysin